jgi:hypothetical protein
LSNIKNLTLDKMGFIVETPLSENDKNNLKTIYEELEKITLPTTYNKNGGIGHQLRLGADTQRNARHTTFGLTRFQGKTQKSRYASKYPHMLPLFEKFIKEHLPDFEYTSVYVNRNVKCKPHYDKINIKDSLIVGCGDFTGGETVVDEEDFDIKENSVMFNASEILHSSKDWEGTRYSLVFFSIK